MIVDTGTGDRYALTGERYKQLEKESRQLLSNERWFAQGKDLEQEQKRCKDVVARNVSVASITCSAKSGKKHGLLPPQVETIKIIETIEQWVLLRPYNTPNDFSGTAVFDPAD